jgi:uncharacterized protein (DUF488 family)
MSAPGGEALLTVGHGARPVEGFVALLTQAEIVRVVDIRTYPGSRRHPHFGREALSATLARAGIGYRWEPALGGFRRPRPDSPHVALHNESFRGYADHMESAEFRDALELLLDEAGEERVAAMCSESVWWRCHRRLLADAALARGAQVLHVMDGPRLEPHRLTPGARVDGADVRYDLPDEQQRLIPEDPDNS